MTTCTHTVDCGPLGEVELTISYKYRPAHNGRGREPDEAASASIYWIKLGSQEVEVSDDYLTREIIPACVADYDGAKEEAAEAYADAVRQECRERVISQFLERVKVAA